jgi:hypothetical protein
VFAQLMGATAAMTVARVLDETPRRPGAERME